ncbi:nickel pincer cofactor biosynthesis protein LarC [Halohasta salina]|uniref:nickel pincer cofactor biosynthesis protein LarC n=1 Tax=Halohasta salina TaxID=2961621 RepID=UPI0020A2FDB0|nr:nickel pincer cofactor biosynthesis protein LarC [Halohasta salina]
MRTLAFDGRLGASGDMILGALLAAGADRSALDPVESALPVEYVVEETITNGIAATTVDVVVTDDGGDGREAADGTVDNDDDQGHTHDHDHDHNHDRKAEGRGPHRNYETVVDIVEGMGLPEAVETTALGAFRRLGEAEAAVHGESLEEIHFHEVGADDAIADIVGAALLVADLDVDRIVTTPVSVGGGQQAMGHGTYPIPAPAVVEIAETADWPIRGGPIEAELLTPTGAAILAEIATGVDTLPALSVTASGYGAGDRSFESYPNVLRSTVGDDGQRLDRESITVLETNLDDAPPELLGGLQETLADAGARDVSILPATMKKSRPGHLVKVICKPEDAERVAHRLALETGTLGVREHGAGHRWTADRRIETVDLTVDGTNYAIDVKVASTTDGEVYDVSAEYDDAAAVAAETGRPIGELMRRAEAALEDGY